MTTEGSGGGDEAGVALISRERELLRGEADSGGLPSMSAFEEARAGRQLTRMHDSQSLWLPKLRVGTPKLERARRDLLNGTLVAL